MVKISRSHREQIAIWRLGILGRVLAAQPEVAKPYLVELVEQDGWKHPITGETVKMTLRTLQRWYMLASKANNAMDALMPSTRKDKGKSKVISESIIQIITVLYNEYSHWSWKLLHDNVSASIRKEGIGKYIPSYSSVRRYLIRNQMRPLPRKDRRAIEAQMRKKKYGSPLFEVEYVGGLLHTDYHHASIQVVTSNGSLKTPLAVAYIDDRSRYIFHIQWYLEETCENLTHCFIQAIMRRGLPRSNVSDNGGPMIAGEFIAGGENLGIVMQRIKPRSPWMNGKIESFWTPLEGRLMSMLQNVKGLTLSELNRLTHIWVEQEYHRSIHSELKDTPLNVFLNHKSVMRDSPTKETLEKAFRISEDRRQRMSDNTISISGVRYQVPKLYWNQSKLRVSYARWNLKAVDILNDETGKPIASIYPVDKLQNATMNSYKLIEMREGIEKTLPPLLQELYYKSKDSGSNQTYIPKDDFI